ncbi:MAG: polynucleotide adenylyltransferase PcnB [Leptospiraceae bacterium]|nr:polynucleotide adenylyltransferase PcnB [Leptospiraceae bacterium]MDW8307675.1 polynucleotide adenylyltransferase PcnB [Leptospiraceae bacterium]
MWHWLRKLLSKSKAKTLEKILRYPEGKRIYPDFHGIRRHMIDPDATKVVSRLQQHGYKAYIVGGSIRDLLLERQPKDFDVVTNARPNDVRKLFANSRLIGRRFRLVHIVFRGSKIVEVSTARSLPESRFRSKKKDELMLKRDNQYGTFKEDAARRDFTINSLFFDLRNETLIDYTGGYEDIQEKIIRVVGDPEISLPEDPVRMLRAAKFAALLNFNMDPSLKKAIGKYRHLISRASRARLHEEYNKIFRTGQSTKIFAILAELGLLEAMFPQIYRASFHQTSPVPESEFYKYPLGKRLAIADKMILEHEDINTTIYYAILTADLCNLPLQPSVDEKNFVDRELEKQWREALSLVEEELGLSRREKERLIEIFASQNVFLRDAQDRRGWVRDFRQQDYFLESFIFYKIQARASERSDLIQKALFWEIDIRKKLPDAIKKITQKSIHLERGKSTQARNTRYKNHLRTEKSEERYEKSLDDGQETLPY